jgi:hypothetical protein
MKIVQLNDLAAPGLASILRGTDYVAVESTDVNTIIEKCNLSMIASGGYYLKECPDVLGLFVIEISPNESFTVVGPGNDHRPFYTTREDLRNLINVLLKEAPIWVRLKRWTAGLPCCRYYTGFFRST